MSIRYYTNFSREFGFKHKIGLYIISIRNKAAFAKKNNSSISPNRNISFFCNQIYTTMNETFLFDTLAFTK